MAEAGHPQGDVIPSDPITTSERVIPLLKGSEKLEMSLPPPKDLQKHSSEVPCLEKNQEDASHIKAKPCVTGVQCVVDSKQGRPHSIAEVHISDGVVGVQKGDGVNHRNEHPLFFMQKSFSLQKDLRGDKLESSQLPAEKSCSEILESERESPVILPLCESSGPACAVKDQKRPARSLVCKQAMQLQQSNTVTTFCRASSSSLSSPTQQGCARVCNSNPVQALKESGGETKHSRFAEKVCCGTHFHGPFEDTFAAYCHPQPIPAPAQLLPRLTGMEEECNSRGQIGGPVLLSLPPLISSVSETGLDAKRVLRCCHLDCNWPGPLHHPGCQQLAAEVRKCTREAGTMTSCQELRDMGVQVGQTELEKPPQHVFPEVCLVEDKTNKSDKPVPSQKTPVKEVKWDAEGMTWEVYGASVDPEELGLAIQKHLELQIKEAAGRGSNISRENTSMSQTSIRKEQPKSKRGVMAALRRPGCCARTTTAVD